MTNALNASKPAVSPTLEAEQVKEHLEKNPNFLLENPALLASINLNIAPGQNTSSLAQRQVDTLRKSNQELQNKLSNLIATAKKNEQLFSQTRKLITKISAAHSNSEILDLLNTCMTNYFNVDQCNVILFTEYFSDTNKAQLINKNDAKKTLDPIINNQQKICGQLRDEERQLLFSTASENIRSAAIIPLIHNEKMLGIISLGSFQADYFRTGSQTDFIDFLTDIVSERLDSNS